MSDRGYLTFRLLLYYLDTIVRVHCSDGFPSMTYLILIPGLSLIRNLLTINSMSMDFIPYSLNSSSYCFKYISYR